MPPASDSWSHILVSSGLFEALRHRTRPVEYAALTLAANLPSSTELHTRAWSAHPQTAASSLVRPWLSAWNHAAILPSRARFGLGRTLPPRFAKKKLSAFFSLAMASYRNH